MKTGCRTLLDRVAADHAGLALHELHRMHPAEFGCPAHFEWRASAYHYTAAGLLLLASSLRQHGQTAASARLEAAISFFNLTTPTDQLIPGSIYA